MSADSLHELLDTAKRLGLLTEAEHERVTQDFQADKPSTFSEGTSRLVAKQTLSAYQIELLAAGKEEECVLAGRYHLLEMLGVGGMGSVFKARDAKLDRLVAIKIMAPHLVENPDAIMRFRREARALAHLSHPGIVQAYDTGEDAGRHFLVMEFVEGQSLARVLHDKGAIPPTRAADYVYQAALALYKAHSSGLVHRDLKPANLLVTSEGKVKILDLGLARFVQDQVGDGTVTREGMGLGTPDYMAPEQFRDAHRVDPRADLYSLGCTLFHLLTGRVPFPGSSLSDKVKAHEEREAPALEALCPDVPAGLVFVVRRMMLKRPEERFQTAQEVAEALAPYVAGSSASLPELNATKSWQGSQLSFSLRPRRKNLRRRIVVAGAGAAVLLVAAVLAWPRLFPRSPSATPNRTVVSENEDKDPPKIVTIPNGLTVAQDGTGQFKTINEALEKTKPGMTVRVLDDATYKETLFINRPAYHAGITLEAERQATLLFPKCKVGLHIAGVQRVTVRGFKLRHEDEVLYMIGVGGKCQGVRLERLDVKINNNTSGAVTLEGIDPGDELSVVENCTIQGGGAGLRVSGYLDYATSTPCGTLLLRDNTILDTQQSILLMGTVKNIHLVGNRIAFANLTGIQFENLLAGTEDILVANNTMLDCGFGIRLWDDGKKKDLGKRIRLINNLVLGSKTADMAFVDSGGDPSKVNGPGNGRSLHTIWTWEKNWRETTEPKGADVFSKSWIPIASADTRQETIEVLSRDPRQAEFLHPAKDSPLAKAGKGGDFPTYVGAVGPEGASPWDWQATWEAQVHNRITVSKDPKAGGRFRTIKEALDNIKPTRTVLVLDDGTYTETLFIRGANHHGITLESPRRATLNVPESSHMGLTILNVPKCTVRGFRLVTERKRTFSIGVGGVCPDLTLENLDFRSSAAETIGVTLEGADMGSGPGPIVIRKCTFVGCGNAIQLLGKIITTKQPTLCRGVALYDNRISDGNHAINAVGQLKDILIAGNRVWDCAEAGITLEDVYENSSSILIANNSVKTSRRCLNVVEPLATLENMVVRNNLLMAESGPDFSYTGKNPATVSSWQIENNWRQAKPPPKGSSDIKEWVISDKDRFVDRLELLSLDPEHADYLRPSTKPAEVAADPAFPPYVGALPPPGTQPWQWHNTWSVRFSKTPASANTPKKIP